MTFTIFALVGIILYWLVRVYEFVLWARLILDLVRAFNPHFRPRGPFLILVELVYTLTDPPIRFFRKLLPPIRLGQIALDLGWMLTMLSCFLIRFLITVLIG